MILEQDSKPSNELKHTPLAATLSKEILLFDGTKTPFAQKIYAIVAKIPIGKTLSYTQVAIAAGNPKAARAIGNIMNKNRDMHVPCHRVVRSDGSIGGYAFGGKRKKDAS